MDDNFAPHVDLQAEVEGVHSKPCESGQHEVVHEGRHDLTGHVALKICHIGVDQEGEAEQEHGHHQVNEDPCCSAGFFPPA